MDKHPGIRIDKIPVIGAAGFIFVVGTLMIYCIGLKAAREFLLLTVPVGLLVGLLLYLYRARTR